jgi:O-antigen biosynthesis protein
MKAEFEKNNIQVFNLLKENLPLNEYDIAWCHHSPVLSHIINSGVKIKKIVYHTLSFLNTLEALPYYTKDLDIVLAVSGATAEKYFSNGWIDKKDICVFPNSVPASFFINSKTTPNRDLKKIAVVSNHVPKELSEAIDILRNRSIGVDIMGLSSKYQLISPDVLLPYDVIISIGKTVQYCFALGIPVYCYDYFGGPGYISKTNFEKTEYHNFSGKCYNRQLEAAVLAKEIISGYEEALKNAQHFKEIAKEKYNLKANVENILGQLEKIQINNVFYNRVFSRELKIHLKHNEYYIDRLKKDRTLHKKEFELLNLKTEISEKDKVIAGYQKELNSIYTSHSWRYTAMLRKIGAFIRQKLWIIKNSVLSISKIFFFFREINSNHNFLITVVIPIYDRTDILEEAIESILNQTYKNFELLLICDGSPADTLEIVKKYETNPKVRVFKYKDNSGNAVRGRNKAIQQARGKYLAFLDSDDIAKPKRLETSYRVAEQYNADLVYGACKVKKSKESINPNVSNGQKVFDPHCDYEYMLCKDPIIQSTVMAKTEVLRNVGGLKPEMQYCEDYELWLRMAHLGYKFKPIPDVLVTLRIHNQNLEHRFRDKQKIWQQKALSDHKIIPKLKPSIAFVIPGEGLSGGIMVICQHANRLIRKGYDVILINQNLRDPFKLDWFPNLLSPIIPINKLDLNLDIVIATQWSTVYTVIPLPAKRKLYFIQSDETRFNPLDSPESELARQTYTFDFELIVIARWLKKWLKEKFNKDSYYVPNGLDTSLFYPDEPLVPKNKKLRVLLEGSIDIPFKGMKEAFEVVDGMDCEVWCVSSFGKPKPGWHCDRFFEKVPLKDMRRIYCSCDVLIKMTKVEGFFMPPLEMMACGGTVITNKVTGYDEYIIDGYNGLVVEQGDVAAAREKLNILIRDRNLLEKLIKGGIETAKKWTWEESNNEFVKILENNSAS